MIHSKQEKSIAVGYSYCYRKHMLFFMMMVLFIAASQFAMAAQQRGLAFSYSRLVFMQKEGKSATIGFENNSNNVYLIQSWVRKMNVETGGYIKDSNAVPFLVLPPLTRLEPKQTVNLKIMIRPHNTLPSDRESAFYLAAAMIPSTSKSIVSHNVAEKIINNVKLFYRPKGLSTDAIRLGIARELKFKQTKTGVVVINPTPYFMTFAELKVGEQEVDPQSLFFMLPPKSQKTYSLKIKPSLNQDVFWRVIDEYGSSTAIYHSKLA